MSDVGLCYLRNNRSFRRMAFDQDYVPQNAGVLTEKISPRMVGYSETIHKRSPRNSLLPFRTTFRSRLLSA